MGHRRRRQRVQKAAPVASRPQPRVQQGQHAAVGAVPQQPAEPLQQGQDGERDLVVGERVAAVRVDLLHAGRGQGIARGGERQLVDHHAAQRVAGDVHPLPEAGGGQEHRVGRGAELPQQHAARRRALRQQRVGQRRIESGAHVAEVGVAGEEDERAAAGDPQQRRDLPRHRGGEAGVVRRRHPARKIEDRLLAVVELRRQPQLGGVGDAQPPAHVRERLVHGQRGGGQDDALHPFDQQLADDARHVDRGGAQEQAASAPFQEVDVRAVGGGEQELQLGADLLGAPAERGQVGVVGGGGQPRRRGGQLAEAPSQAAGGPGGRRERVGGHPGAFPGRGGRGERAEEELRVVAHAVQQIQHLARGRLLDFGRPRPVAGDEPPPVVIQLVEPAVADGDAEVLGRHVLELVGFVDHRGRARRNHLAVGALPHRGVRAQQVVVDDDHVRLGRPLPHLRDEALLVGGALRADAVLRRRRDVVPERQVVGQVLDLGPVPGRGPAGPLGELAEDAAFGQRQQRAGRFRARRLEAVQAEVVAAPLHVRGAEVDAERLPQVRQVLVEDLVLQVPGAGRDEDAPSAEDGGHQVGQGLAGSGARFGQQHAAGLQHARRGGRHAPLARPRLERGHRARQRAALGERRGDPRF